MELNVDKILKPIDSLLERLSVDTVFGKPTKEGDTTVIPVADVAVGFGYGYGEGGAGPSKGDSEEGVGGEGGMGAAASVGGAGGSGAGGGGGGRASPRGYLKIAPDGVTYEPIMDQSRIALAGIALSAWVVFWIARTVRAFARECDCQGECKCGGHGKCECDDHEGE